MTGAQNRRSIVNRIPRRHLNAPDIYRRNVERIEHPQNLKIDDVR